MSRIQTRLFNILKALAVLSLLFAGVAWAGVGHSEARGFPGAVYVLSNQTSGNSVLIFNRASDGTLSPAGSAATGGTGTGAGLGSQGALALSRDNRWLFAVNAGSNDISSFRVMPEGLQLVSRVASGGTDPISLTTHGDLLYVLNAGGAGNITGFSIDNGVLSPIPGSTRPLSGSAVGPAEVQFSPNGRLLVVTEKATNKIDTYTVDDGIAGGPNVQNSAGMTPFGFAIAHRGQLIVSEAFGGAPNASALSSYATRRDGQIEVISASSPTHQTAACWVTVTDNGRYTYTTNAGSGSVSGYRIARDGTLTLLNPDGRTGVTGDGSSPIDLGLDHGSQHLYVVTSGSHGIAAFDVNADGSLTNITAVTGLPAGAVGIAVR